MFNEADRDYFRQKAEEDFEQIIYPKNQESTIHNLTQTGDTCPLFGLNFSDMILEEKSGQPANHESVSTTPNSASADSTNYENLDNTLNENITCSDPPRLLNNTLHIPPNDNKCNIEPSPTKNLLPGIYNINSKNTYHKTVKEATDPDLPYNTETREKIHKEFSQLPDEPDKRLKKFRIAKEFNELMCLLDSILQTNNIDPRCSSCLNCGKCKELAITCNTNLEARQHMEEIILKECIKFDPNRGNFCVPLPLKDDPETALGDNADQSKSFYKRVVNKLAKSPDDRKAIIKSFNKQIELGFIQKLSTMPKELQDSITSKKMYVIPWNFVYKEASISTPVRIVINASSKTSTGKSLNQILCKGLPKINLLPLLMTLTADPVLLTLDLQKFYNSAKLPDSHYHLQCVWWQQDLDESIPPELYVLKTHTYGVVSSGRILELCLEKLAQANIHNTPFHRLFTKTVYVDDAFASCRSKQDAEKLIEDCKEILPRYGFTAKGYAQSYVRPAEEISEMSEGLPTVSAVGMLWVPETDILRIRPPYFNFGGKKNRGKITSGTVFTGQTFDDLNKFVPLELTLRMAASQVASVWDPCGLAGCWYLGVKHILRMSVSSIASKGREKWEMALNKTLRDLWVVKFWEMIQLSKINFPRCTFPTTSKYTEHIIVSLSDMGKIGKLQCFYSLKKISRDNYHVQLIYSKSQLGDKRSVPCQELDSMNEAASVLDRICTCFERVDRRAMLVDSTPCIYWLSKDPVQLNTFHRLKVMNILRNCDKKDIFHLPTNYNSSDVGTKSPVDLKHILPGSFFSKGPNILKFGIDGCMERSYIKSIDEVLLNPAVKAATDDGFTHPHEPKLFNITGTQGAEPSKAITGDLTCGNPTKDDIQANLDEELDDSDKFVASFKEDECSKEDEEEIYSIVDEGTNPNEFIGAFSEIHRSHKIQVLKEVQSSAMIDQDSVHESINIFTKLSPNGPTPEEPWLFGNNFASQNQDLPPRTYNIEPDLNTEGTLPQLPPSQGVQFGRESKSEKIIQHMDSQCTDSAEPYQRDNPCNNQDPDKTILAVGKEFQNKVTERFEFNNYLVNPLSRTWAQSIRIVSIVLNFLRQLIIRRIQKNTTTTTQSALTDWQAIHQRIFCSEHEPVLQDCFTNLCFIVSDNLAINRKTDRLVLAQTRSSVKNKPIESKKLAYTDMFKNIQMLKVAKHSAILYFLRLASKELSKFYPNSILRKHTFVMQGLHFSKQRLLECDNIDDLMESEVASHELGISNLLPCTDRYSPVGISIMMHMHRRAANHLGVDRTWSTVLSSVYIFQGQSLLKDIVRSCFHCRRKLRKKFNTNYGPINKMSLTFAPVNEHVMLDMSGPYLVKSRINSKTTRAGSNLNKVYLLHTVCLTSYLHTIVIVEDYSAQGFTDALHRISSRYGYPSIVYTDGSTSQLKSLLTAQFTMKSFAGSIYKETGIEVRVSGSGGSSHSRQGRVERAIALFQRFVENKRASIQELTILQFDSLICQATAFLNSMPLCHKKRVGTCISSSLISPNSFLLGRRNNTRAPAGCPLLPDSRGKILEAVQKASDGMLKYFTSAIPDLLLRPSNQKDPDKIRRGDMVLFAYEENAMAITYKLGLVTRLEFDGDDVPRIAELSYSNAQENDLPLTKTDKTKPKSTCRLTRKGIHTLIKIYSAEDADINTDIDSINSSVKTTSSLRTPETIKESEKNKEHGHLNTSNTLSIADTEPVVPHIPKPLLTSQLAYLTS